jgi:invasion protein IalB
MNKMTERLVIGAAALVVGLLLGWAIHGIAGYSTTTELGTTVQDWRLVCPAASVKDADCEMIQDILDSKSHTTIMRVAISKDAGKPVMGVTLPLGVLLPPGVALQWGTQPIKQFPYRTCNTTGCIAEWPIDDKLQASLDAGVDGGVLFMGLDQKAVKVPLSLKGFRDAQSAYRSNERKRSSWFWRMF